MLNTTLLYLGAAVLVLWGVAHIIPTRNVVAGFGALSDDNRINITMCTPLIWLAGIALVGASWPYALLSLLFVGVHVYHSILAHGLP
jgi:hypothetical protein